MASQPGLSDQPIDLEAHPPERGVFANRTLNLRSVKAIGYDMDYTLIHYRVNEWEGHAFEQAREILGRRGLPVDDLAFDVDAFTIGLTFDLQLGNVIKATRFGYVVRAQHGNRQLPFGEVRDAYTETVIDLAEPRFEFMNTMFELSRASLWTQLVELHDDKPLPGVTGYDDLYRVVDEALTETHLTSSLKADIVADPDRFVEPDPDLVPALLDQRLAGKQLLLITNSDWAYTKTMMAYTVDPYCPNGTSWRDLFDIVIVSANKPQFFSRTNPIYRVVDEERSMLQPHYGLLESGAVYFGGNARLVEQSLLGAGQSGSAGQPLYVGDHLFGDVLVTKDILRWRTALVVRELESEITDAMKFESEQRQLEQLMARKVELDRQQARLRLAVSRPGADRSTSSELHRVSSAAMKLDEQIAPLAAQASNLGNQRWGALMRSGRDKSLFARQVERYADVYMSRVSNLRYQTPFAYIRASPGSLPHDSAIDG